MTDRTDALPDPSPEGADVGRDTPDAPIQKNMPSSSVALKTQLRSYKMDNPRRGVAVIINNRHFDERTGQKERIGTDTDADNMTDVLTNLGFKVRRFDNLDRITMTLKSQEVANEDHSDADCFVFVILSHGEENKIYATNGTMKLEDMVRWFKGDQCPTLAGKPKLFFIQACRGRNVDFGVEVAEGMEETDAAPIEEKSRKIPVEADFLMAYSVVPGYFSWRNSEDGSWFVQALVRVFREHAQSMELMQMMTLVNHVVAYEFESCTDSMFTDHLKQIPCMVSMLTKQVFFTQTK